MPVTARNTIKNWFKKGLKPLETHFASWLDSFWHKEDDLIPMSAIEDLLDTLNSLATSIAVTNAIDSLRTEIKAGVPIDGDTLEKLYNLIVATSLSTLLDNDNDAGAFQIKNLADPTDDQDADTKIARDTAIAAAIANLINSAPGALDTLNELADALGDDPNFATTVTNALALKAPLASPALTGTPTSPTAAPGTNTTQVATTAFVTAAVAVLAAIVDLKQALVNAAVALVDGAVMDLTAIKHTLASSSATRTFTISYTGDDITLEVTLGTDTATYTFPAASLCVSEGVASGNNTLTLSGVSGDKYVIAIKKIGAAYYVVCKNFGQ